MHVIHHGPAVLRKAEQRAQALHIAAQPVEEWAFACAQESGGSRQGDFDSDLFAADTRCTCGFCR
jgi:hypothetical protein